MTFEQNEGLSPETMGKDVGAAVDAPLENQIGCEDEEPLVNDDREEYERLIKGRFKEHFADDAQRLINRRFKKYKALEERLGQLEESARRYADIDRLLCEERERAVRETEERMTRQFRANMQRAAENATLPHTALPSVDVTRLTRSQRALLASRALRGEKIHL